LRARGCASPPGGVSYRLEAIRRDDGMLALDSTLRCDGDPTEQVIGGLLVALADLPLARTAIDRVLGDLDPTSPRPTTRTRSGSGTRRPTPHGP
jgi:hypothetical protein